VIAAIVEYSNPALWREWLAAGVNQLGFAAFWFAGLEIVFINCLLSGDNALVIAMACRGLPAEQRRWGLIGGAGIAIALRIIFTGIVARLMLVAYLKLIGGLALLVIAARLLVPDSPDRNKVEAVAHLWRAIGVVVAADLIMSLDNIIAVAAAARGDFLLLGIGLAMSIPLIIAGAAFIGALLDRFPILIWAGAALLGWVAGEAIASDPALSGHLAAKFGATLAQHMEAAAPATGAALVIAAGGLWRRWQQIRAHAAAGAQTGGV
jgi:YjbE family integral membrane protein